MKTILFSAISFLLFLSIIVIKMKTLTGSPIVRGFQVEKTKKWILTAAHCVYDRNITNLSIQVGIRILSSIDQPRYKIEKFELDGFNEYTMRNDIALIRMAAEYKYPFKYLEIVAQDELNDAQRNKSNCKIIGFGSHKYGDVHQKNLFEANVNLITNEECVAVLGRIMAPQAGDNTVCAVGTNGEDACQGDSGGPLIYELNGIDYVYGIVSHGLSCGSLGVPSVYTLVGKYKSWIEYVLQNDK